MQGDSPEGDSPPSWNVILDVPNHPPRTASNTLEDTLINPNRITTVPRIPQTANYSIRPKRPTTSFATDSIYSNMSTPYDISHRRNHTAQEVPIQEELPQNKDPTFVNVNPPKNKFWISDRRQFAQELKSELDKLQIEAELESQKAETEFDQSTSLLQRMLSIHQSIISKFSEKAPSERTLVLNRISKYYQNLADEIPRLQLEYEEQIKKTNEKLNLKQNEKNKLADQLQSILNAIDRQNKVIENLKGQITEYRNRCTNAENQFREATDEKTAMTRSSHANQQKLSDIMQQIVDKRAQKEKLSELVDTLSKDITRRTSELQEASTSLESIEKEIHKLSNELTNYKKIIADRAELLDKLKKTPLRDANKEGRSTVSIQVNRLPKAEKTRAEQSASQSSINGQNQFIQIKSDMSMVQQAHDTQTIQINNSEELFNIRKIILENNNIFDFSVESITRAHLGNFSLHKSSEDEVKIFSKWIIRRVLNNSLDYKSHSESSAQTDKIESISEPLFVSEVLDEVDTDFKGAPKSLLPFLKSSRLPSLLKSTDDCSRPPKPLDWLVHAIRSIFDEKYVDDKTEIKGLQEYLLIWAFRQFGSENLIVKNCWDIFISSHHHMQKYLEVTLFVRFLDETWTTDQLTFFLRVRVWILQRCVSYPVEHLDLNEYFMETYLTKSQVFDCFAAHFLNVEKELLNDLSVRGCSCADSNIVKERGEDSACVPMNRILELAVGEFMDCKIRKLRKMLAFYQIVPRMTLKRFGTFLKGMIPTIDLSIIDSLTRSSAVKNTLRTDLDSDEFIRIFESDEGLKYMSGEEFCEFSDVYSMVYGRWKQFSHFLSRMVEAMEKSGREESKILVNEIRHQVFQLLEAKVTFDGVLFYQNFHKVLQTVLKACLRLGGLDSFTFVKQVEDLEGLIYNKFQIAMEAKEVLDEN